MAKESPQSSPKSIKRVRVLDRETGYDKKILLKKFQKPNGMVEKFFVDEDGDSVQIFALTSDQKVLTVLQFRPANEKINHELPGGGVEEGEDPEKAAARELVEETGYEHGKIVHIASLNYSPYSTGVRHMFMATDCTKKGDGSLDLDPNESLKVEIVDLENKDFLDKVKTGTLRGHDHVFMCLARLGLLGILNSED